MNFFAGLALFAAVILIPVALATLAMGPRR